MSTFQILMFAVSAYFAYQIFRHVQTLEEPESNPEPNVELLVEQADKAYERGAIEMAREKLEEAVRLNPTSTDILNKLGYVQVKEGHVDEGIETYKRSLEHDGQNDLTHNAIASLYRSRGDFMQAKEHYDAALMIDDAYAQTYYNYGNLLSDMEQVEEARAMYERALELQENFDEAREALEQLKAGHAG